MSSSRLARSWRTTAILESPRESFRLILAEIGTLVSKADRQGLKPAVRLNGTSDIDWQATGLIDIIAATYPIVRMYDYTKVATRALRQTEDYHLTLSVSRQHSPADIAALLSAKIPLAMVTPVGQETVANVVIGGKRFKANNGDVTDLRFLDKSGTLTLLKAKAVSKNLAALLADSGMVRDLATLGA